MGWDGMGWDGMGALDSGKNLDVFAEGTPPSTLSNPPSPRPPLIFHHRPPQIDGGDQRRNFPYPSHHHLQQPNVPPSSNPKTPPHSPFCKSHPIPSHPIPSYPIPSLDQKYRTPKPQSPAPNSHRPPKSTGVIKGGTSPTPATATTSLS